jgi:hypothetical protein
MFIRADFPDPLLPSIPKTVPSLTVMSRFLSILTPLKVLVTFFIYIKDI